MTTAAGGVCTVCALHAESIFRVEGMDCHEEVALIERRFKHLSGFEAVAADVMGGRLRVQYDAALLSTGAIVAAVADTGMRAWLEHEEPRPGRREGAGHLADGQRPGTGSRGPVAA